MDIHFFVAHWRPDSAADAADKRASGMAGFAVSLSTGETFAKRPAPSAQAIGPFCYPLGTREREIAAAQSAKMKYTFTLMDADGKWLHGFCRRSPAPPLHNDSEPVRFRNSRVASLREPDCVRGWLGDHAESLCMQVHRHTAEQHSAAHAAVANVLSSRL